MPILQDYDPNEDDKKSGDSGSSGSAGGGGLGSSTQAVQQKQPEQTFTPWSRFVDANQDVADREAAKLNSQVQGDQQKAQSGLEQAAGSFNDQIESNYTHSTDAPATQAQPSQQTGKLGGFGPAGLPTGSFAQPTGATSSSFGDQQVRRQQQLTPAAPPVGALGQAKSVSGTQAPSGKPAPTTLFAKPQPGTRTGLKADAVNGPQGSKSLADSMGATAWNKLIGDTQQAQNESGVSGIGSETGTQALIQQNGNTPNSLFDAALLYGQGQNQFGQTSKAGQNLGSNLVNAQANSQNAWQKLTGDVTEAQRQNTATDEANATNAANAAAWGAAQQTPDAAQTQTGLAALNITQTDGANGQFDAQNFPPNFDPTSDPGYQQALAALEKAAPVPPWADNPHDFLNAPMTERLSQAWAQELGISYDQLRTAIMQMPQWQWELFVRGIVPSTLQRGQPTTNQYFEGLMPVSASGTEQQTEFGKAMQIFEGVVVGLANPIAGAAYKAGESAVAQNAKNPNNNADPLGGRGY